MSNTIRRHTLQTNLHNCDISRRTKRYAWILPVIRRFINATFHQQSLGRSNYRICDGRYI